MRLFIAEKPSVAKAIVNELGVVKRNNGYIECSGQNYVTWCFGHLLEQAEPDAKGQKRDDSTEGAAGAAAADKDAANNDSAAESEAGTEDKAEAEQEEKGFIKKVLAVIFGSDDEVIYYKK